MQNYKTLPSNKTAQSFFQVYGRYASQIACGVIIAQLISATTESGLIFTIVRDSLAVFGDHTSKIIGVIGAIIGVALIELIGLRVALVGLTDAILYKRFSGLEKAFTVLFALLTLVLIPASFYLSWSGGSNIISTLSDKTKDQFSKDQKTLTSEKITTLKDEYKSEKERLTTHYKSLQNAKTIEADAMILAAEKVHDTWFSKGDKYKSRIAKAYQELQSKKAYKASELAFLIATNEDELKALQSKYDARISELKAASSNAVAVNKTKVEAKEGVASWGAKVLVMIAMIFSIIGVVMERIFKKGSGIEELAAPSNFQFDTSIIKERLQLFSDKRQIRARNKIAAKRAALPQLEVYESNIPLRKKNGFNDIEIVTMPSMSQRKKIGFKHYENESDNSDNSSTLKTSKFGENLSDSNSSNSSNNFTFYANKPPQNRGKSYDVTANQMKKIKAVTNAKNSLERKGEKATIKAIAAKAKLSENTVIKYLKMIEAQE